MTQSQKVMEGMQTVLVRVPVAEIKHHDQKQLEEERGLFHSQFITQIEAIEEC